MAKTLEEVIFINKAVLRNLLVRESKLLALKKKPVNTKISNFVKKQQDGNLWSDFLDSLNEDLTRNINVYEWKIKEEKRCNIPRRIPFNTVSRAKNTFHYAMLLW